MDNLIIIITIIGSIIGIIGAIGSYYFYVKAKLNQLTVDVINIAEDTDKVKQEKMQIAISALKRLLPPGASFFFDELAMEEMVQKAFDKIEEYAKKQANKK